MCKALEELMEQGRQEGRKEGELRGEKRGREQGIAVLIETCHELGRSKDETMQRIRDKFSLTRKTAELMMGKYWVW